MIKKCDINHFLFINLLVEYFSEIRVSSPNKAPTNHPMQSFMDYVRFFFNMG